MALNIYIDMYQMSNISELASLLMSSRTQAHVFHLRTNKYSKHVALQNYYNRIVPLTNSYIETYQGKSGRLVNGIRNKPLNNNARNSLGYFLNLRQKIDKLNLPRNSELQNILDEIKTLIDSTIYKLQFLS